jgi:hypothetical protein
VTAQAEQLLVVGLSAGLYKVPRSGAWWWSVPTVRGVSKTGLDSSGRDVTLCSGTGCVEVLPAGAGAAPHALPFY